MAIYGTELIRHMADYASPSLAVPKDKIGLQVGDPNQPVNKVLVTLDVTPAVIDEAIRVGANWIIAHHAVIFQPLTVLRVDTPAGKLYQKCLKHDLNILIAHTNLDITTNGVNDVLANKLSLNELQPMFTEQTENLHKLVIFVPTTHIDAVRTAISEAGAGDIGNYSHCTFQTNGVGTFLPKQGTTPYTGTPGKQEKVDEVRLETIVPAAKQMHVIEVMLAAHPYEEVAYDVYPVLQKGKPQGLGRIGERKQAISLAEFAQEVKQAYRIQGLRVVGDLDKKVQKVAVLGGSGARYWAQAKQLGADVYITGDIDFHSAQDAQAAGMCLIDPGHHVEHHVVPTVCSELTKRLPNVEIVASEIDTNPFRFL